MIDNIIHIALLLLFPPLLLGVIGKTKAWFGGRTGARFLQPYYDIVKLLRKGLVLSETTTWIFRAGPVVTFAATLVAGLLLPLGRFPAPISFTGDLILFAYLFGLARFFTTSAALDTGSAFEGMGSSREVTFAVLSEPALFFAYLTLAKASRSISLDDMLLGYGSGFSAGIVAGTVAPFVLVAIGLFIVLLAETCRIPVDDPTTHLELTMIHEAMVLDHSGPLFGTILYASAMKLFVLGSFLLHVVAPFSTGNAWIDRSLFIAEMLLLAVVIGVLESVTARLRMRRVPYLLVSALLLCGSGFVLLVR
jgi:formate hydrogenlyase subunit 4